MAYLRRENKKGQVYVSLCENYRDANGKSQRRVLHNLGNLNKLNPESLKNLATKILTLIDEPIPDTSSKELGRYNYGFVQVLYHIFSEYKLNNLFRNLSKKHKLSYELIQPILLMVCDRINDPISKLGSHILQHEYYGLEQIDLHHLYRSLDYLALHNEKIQSHIYSRNRDLFNYELDVVFFDVTTFYFDSNKEEDGALRQMGFGKDGKIGKTQIVFSLLIDKNKMPIGFEIFNGKQFEGHTFENALKALKEKYAIGKVIVVADSGMMSKKNIEHFTEDGIANTYEYIVGDRLKNLPNTVKAHLINKSNYKTEILVDKKENASPLKVCIYEHGTKKIIGTWSKKRASKDKYERENRVKKATTLMKMPDQLKKKAKNYYLKTADKIIYELDTQRIKEDAKYDGFKAISTNAKTISIELVLEHYAYLYQIEHCFRTFKSFLETRPMFHWTDERIKGHLVMCYISFIVLRYIEEKTNCTEQQIRKHLSQMQMSKVKSNEKTFWLRANHNEQLESFIKKLNIKQLPETISTDSIKNYIPNLL